MIDKAKHIAAATEALALFQQVCGTVDAHAIADLICDLGLLADERGLDFLSETKRGMGHWFTERHTRPGNNVGTDAIVEIQITAKAVNIHAQSRVWKERKLMAKSVFEVPSEVQAVMEQSVRQARAALEGFTTATRNMVGSMEHALPSAARELNSKAFSYAEANIKATCDFAEKLSRAKDAQELMQLQSEFAKTQFETLQEQTKEIGAAVQGALKGSGETPEQEL